VPSLRWRPVRLCLCCPRNKAAALCEREDTAKRERGRMGDLVAPTRAYIHGFRGGADVDPPLVWPVGEVESESGVDVGLALPSARLSAAVISARPRRRSRISAGVDGCRTVCRRRTRDEERGPIQLAVSDKVSLPK